MRFLALLGICGSNNRGKSSAQEELRFWHASVPILGQGVRGADSWANYGTALGTVAVDYLYYHLHWNDETA